MTVSETIKKVAFHTRLAELCSRAYDPHCCLNLIGTVDNAVRNAAVQDLHLKFRSIDTYHANNEFTAVLIQVFDVESGALIMCPVVRNLLGPDAVFETLSVNRGIKAQVHGISVRVLDKLYMQTAMELSTKELETGDKFQIVLTGFQEGAIVAQLLAATLASTFSIKEVVVFGSLPIGDDIWAHHWSMLDIDSTAYAIREDPRVKETKILKHAIPLKTFPRLRERSRGLCDGDTGLQMFMEDTSCFLLKNVPFLHFIPSLIPSLEDAKEPITIKSYAHRIAAYLEKLTDTKKKENAETETGTQRFGYDEVFEKNTASSKADETPSQNALDPVC